MCDFVQKKNKIKFIYKNIYASIGCVSVYFDRSSFAVDDDTNLYVSTYNTIHTILSQSQRTYRV